MLSIREAKVDDLNAIHLIYYAAFDEEEKDRVANLAIDLLSENTTPNTFALVAEKDHKILGHVGLSPLGIESNISLTAYILAPLAVMPDTQKQGIGSRLIEYAIDQFTKQGVNLLFVYGDPQYYGRFGFDAENATPYVTPYELKYPFGWLARVLNTPSEMNQQSMNIRCVPSLNDPVLW